MKRKTYLLFPFGILFFLLSMGHAEELPSSSVLPHENPYAQQLLTPDFFKGTPVLNPEQLPVGMVEEVVLDSRGEIAYLLVRSNGFWGTVDQTALVPWQAVRMQSGEDPRVILQVAAGKLEGAPMNLQALGGRPQEEEIHQYYGVAPYWDEVQAAELETDLHPTKNLPQPMLQGGQKLMEGEYEPGSPEEDGER